MEWWIPITLFAVIMQIARTGWQKSLTADLNDWAVSWLRFAFALPLVPLYFALLPGTIPAINAAFVGVATLAAAAQTAATIILVRLFARRNFAVCTAFSKTEAVQIAIFGALFFELPLSTPGIIGVALGTCGVLMMIPRHRDRYTVALGVICGGGFAFAALFIKKAIMLLPDAPPLTAAAMTLAVMLVLQTSLLGAVLWRYQLLPIATIWRVRYRVAAVGGCGFLGSIGWASAFALTHPAFVKTLAQVELPLAYLLGRAAFAEKPRIGEIAGMLTCAIAAVVVAFA